MVRNNEARSTDIRCLDKRKKRSVSQSMKRSAISALPPSFAKIRPDLVEFGYGLPGKSVSH